MNANLPHVVIIGGGFGGLAAAQALAKAPVRITLIDRRNHHLFQPLLHGVALAELSPSDVAYPIRSALRNQANATVLLSEAKAIDAARQVVTITDGELHYDYLIVAAGAVTNFHGPTWAEHALGLKDIDDATEIRRRILLAFEEAEREDDQARREALLTFVVVGGGATGVEVAGSLAELARSVLVKDFRNIRPETARIVLVHGAERLLMEYQPPQSAQAKAYLERLGVDVRTNTRVTALSATGVHLGEQFLPAATIISCAGVRASPITETIGAPMDRAGRLLVEPDLSVPGHREIFVIGDAAAFMHQDGKALPGLAPVAKQQGLSAAANIVADLKGRERKGFVYNHKGSLVTIGRFAAIADLGWLRLKGFTAWLAWFLIHVFFLIGFDNRFIVIFRWFRSIIARQRGARLITGRRMVAGPPPAKKDW